MLNLPKRTGIDRLDKIENIFEDAEDRSEELASQIQQVLKTKKGVYTGDKIIDHILLMTIGTDPSGICRDSVDRAIHGVKHVTAMRETLDKSRGEIALRESIDRSGPKSEWVLEYGRIAKEGELLYLKGISGELPKIGETTEYYLSLVMILNTGGRHRSLKYSDAKKPHNRSIKGDMAYYVGGCGCNYLFGEYAEGRLEIVSGALEKADKSR